MKIARGFTLVELVLIITIAAIGIPGVILTFYEISRKSVYDEAANVSVMLAEGELERVIGKNFSNVTDEHRDNPVLFGGAFSWYSCQIRVDAVSTDLANDPLMAQYKQIEARVSSNAAGNISLKTIVTKD